MPALSARTVRREIEYDPLPSQIRFTNCGALFKVFSGAVGSGKTKALVQEALKYTILNPGGLGLIGAPTYKVLRDTTEREFFHVLDSNHIPYRFHKSDREVVMRDTGSHILFRTLDDPDHLVGTNLSWFAIDEMAYAKEWAFLRLQARLRDPKAPRRCGFGATTPNGFNWVYDRFLGKKRSRHYEMVKAKPGENHYLPADFYETLAASYDERFYRQEVLGEYLALQSGTAYHAFDRERNIDPTIEYRPNAQLCWALDFNVDPMCSVICQIVEMAPTIYDTSPLTRRLEVLDEISIRDGNIDLACAEFVKHTEKWQRLTNGFSYVNVYGDPAGNSRSLAGETAWELVRTFFNLRPRYKMQWNIPDSHPPVVDRVNSVNAMLYDARHETRLTISPKCTALIEDFERVTWKKDAHGNYMGELSKQDKLRSHLSDGLGYLVSEEFSAARITTQTFHSRRLF